MMKWGWRVERDANPNVLRVCWTVLIHIFLHQLRKQLSRIYTTKSRRNLQTFGWCLRFKQLHPWYSNALLLHAKTSRETFAIGIHLLKKRVSEKFSIIYPFWIRKKPLQFWSHWHCCQKSTTSCEHKEGWKEGHEKEESLCPLAHNADV